MKKKIIISGIIIAILGVATLNYKKIYRVYKLNQIKNDIINDANGIFNKRTKEATRKEYELYHKSLTELNHNNITELINVYINSIINGMDVYIKNNEEVVVNKSWEHREINKAKDVEYGKDIWMKYYVIDYGVGESFIDFDVKNYKDGAFKDALIEKLKNCLEYEEKDNIIEWYINSTEDKRIELPYNCYIDYKAYHREDNKEFKRAVDVVFSKDFKLQNNFSKLTVKYETTNGAVKEVETNIYYNSIDGEDYYRVPLYSGLLIFGADTKAECTLSNHTVNRWMEEADIEFFEKYPIVN